MQIDYLKPEGLAHNPAFTQALILPAGARLMVIGGQNSVDAQGNILHPGDLGAQTTQALRNMSLCLGAAGASFENLVKLTIYIAGDIDITPGFMAWVKMAGQPTNPPAITGVKVLALNRPGLLVELEGLAVLPG
jgi:enamine deaminase RidA (YjgF/YER057c/UK114 family)